MSKSNASSRVLSPCGPTPSARQLLWHEMEVYGMICFNLNTFTDIEWGYGDASPALFNPSGLDARQWAKTALDGGLKGLILVCKHHDGFCLWPSRYTEYSVKNSPWKNGKGDVVRELSNACNEFGVKFGVYLSPWDRNRGDYGQASYIEYFHNQLRELLTEYGQVFEVWFDGASDGTGYYGGAREKRAVDFARYFDWDRTWGIVRELQPSAVIYSDVGPDIRWVGNEIGVADKTTWLTLNPEGWTPGVNIRAELPQGHESGNCWIPPEAPVPIRKGWFYHFFDDVRVKSVPTLVDLYYKSVGQSASLMLGLAPDRRGLIPDIDVERLKGFRQVLDDSFRVDLARTCLVTASDTRGSVFDVSCVNDGQPDTYWTTDDGVATAWIEFDLKVPTQFNCVAMREYIAFGQRVQRWTVEAEIDGSWSQISEGTTIGSKRLLRFDAVTTRRVRLNIVKARACPVISGISLYMTPVIADDPVVSRDRNGMLHINASKNLVRFTTDGSMPAGDSPLYRDPFDFCNGGIVTAAVLPEDNPGLASACNPTFVQVIFGKSKKHWKIIEADSQDPDHQAQNAVDDDAATFWLSAPSAESDKHPHFITIDLGEETVVSSFGYLPRQDRFSALGVVNAFAFYASIDGKTWGAPVVRGRFDNIENNPVEQIIVLPEKTPARFVRFESHSSVGNDGRASIAEINVYRH